VNADPTDAQGASSSTDRFPLTGLPADTGWPVWPPARPKFQHRYGLHLTLFALTFLTTTFAQSVGAIVFSGGQVGPSQVFSWEIFRQGLWYSLPLLTILSAHEFGHYFACRFHNVDATLPYFLPAPLPLTGTLGAVIRIKEPFPSKRALFDIGVAGPIAGFVALVPFLYWGMQMSTVAMLPTDGGVIYFGEPLLWKAVEYSVFGSLPEGADVIVHPLGFAAWWGLLATALNLLPFGQLDGGHIMYATLGRHAAWLSRVTLLVVVLLTVQSTSWLAMALMMIVMAFYFGFRHPRVLYEEIALSRGRMAVAAAALVIFVLCFTPVPIQVLGVD
jgi:membrane-associated protease RseP (regulator of RpoE activity)